jgi:hypothetical protein
LFQGRLESDADRGIMKMRRMQLVSIFSTVSVALLCVLAAPARSPAQDAGVSGIPPGPANARGLNGSVNDPSGIGNAARVSAPPSPTITPVRPPALSPSAAYSPLPMRGTVKMRRTRFAANRYRPAAANAHEREQVRRLDRETISICKGC